MLTREILNSHPVKNLKAEISKVKKGFNYGTLKKADLIDLMLEFKDLFSHIKMYKPPERKKPVPKPKPVLKPKEKPKEKSVDKEKEKEKEEKQKQEKEKFFKNYNFKIGDKIIVPVRSDTIQWTITDITPKYIKIFSPKVDKKGIRPYEYYTVNNKIEDPKKKIYKVKEKPKTKIEKLIPGINVNKDKQLKALPKEFIPDENNLNDMKKYKKILDKKNKDKKISNREYERLINEVNKKIKKLEEKPKPQAVKKNT